MRAIWKYEVPMEDEFEVELPRFAKVLSVGVQFDKPVFWAHVITGEAEMETRKFLLVGTGHPMPLEQEVEFIGTFQLLGGQFVGHLFEKV